MKSTSFALALPLAALMAGSAAAQTAACGGDFGQFLQGVKADAVAAGVPANVAENALAGLSPNSKVLSMDRSQGVFKQTFLEFSKRVVSGSRMQIGQKKMQQYADTFARAEQQYGVPPAVITAFWALETDFGVVQGDFNTLQALATLAHDCRRPELFRPQLIAALEMVQHGDLDPRGTTGAWAGEIGQVQMLPEDIIAHGVDGNGDGHVKLKETPEDVIMTAAKFIQSLGWRAGEPWLKEVALPTRMPLDKSGLDQGMTTADWLNMGVTFRDGSSPAGPLPADLLLPQGKDGPAFLAFPNFDVYLEWNKSFIYTTSAAYFATRLAGAERYNAGTADNGLSDGEMKALQQKLAAKGHDVGDIDGILGGGTRTAVRTEQMRLGMPADGWPTRELLNAL
ncbi:MAG: lytic transglycosylase [Rhizobiales bacterium]|nr:lytic transglycosylase [Hyphomicrobiales bacterium]MBA69814.1 lytic transglycosylase [Hyphomicrobiales bacterium]